MIEGEHGKSEGCVNDSCSKMEGSSADENYRKEDQCTEKLLDEIAIFHGWNLLENCGIVE